MVKEQVRRFVGAFLIHAAVFAGTLAPIPAFAKWWIVRSADEKCLVVDVEPFPGSKDVTRLAATAINQKKGRGRSSTPLPRVLLQTMKSDWTPVVKTRLSSGASCRFKCGAFARALPKTGAGGSKRPPA